MWFIYFILILLFLLLFIVIKSSVLNLGFWFLTKGKISTEKLLLPVLLSFVILAGLLMITTLILSQNGLSILKAITKIALRIKYSMRSLGYIIMSYVLCITTYMFIQGFILKLVNLPYYMMYNKIKYKLSKKNDNNPEEIMAELTMLEESMSPLSYFQYYAICILAFAIIFFCVIILGYIGFSTGEIICNKWIK